MAKQWDFAQGVYLDSWMKYQVFTPLLLLQFLNLFWYYLILRILYRYVMYCNFWRERFTPHRAIFQSRIDDVRSDDEDESNEKEE